jgi:NAD-dependent dihydropyrimidine dehydrogenase PreA subunit
MEPSRRFVKLLEKNFSYRFKIAKLTRMPGLKWVFSKMFFDNNDLTYLTKDNVVEIELNKKIPAPESIVVPSEIVKYFIEKSSYRFIMDFCLCREATQCKDYPIHLGCLFMGDSARRIPKELGRPASKKEALAHVEKCRKSGLVHLIGRDKLDETWLGVGSKIPLITVCNCCNCCCLWKMLPCLDEEFSSTVKRMPGLKISINENCNGCGVCSKDICFIDEIKIKDGVAVISDNCLACGRCVEICPQNAIDLNIEDEEFIKKTIERVERATS